MHAGFEAKGSRWVYRGGDYEYGVEKMTKYFWGKMWEGATIFLGACRDYMWGLVLGYSE